MNGTNKSSPHNFHISYQNSIYYLLLKLQVQFQSMGKETFYDKDCL